MYSRWLLRTQLFLVKRSSLLLKATQLRGCNCGVDRITKALISFASSRRHGRSSTQFLQNRQVAVKTLPSPKKSVPIIERSVFTPSEVKETD